MKKKKATAKKQGAVSRGRLPVVVVGSIGLDDIITPFEKCSNLLGGSVSYACAAASFFSRVGMVGVVGTDFPAKYLNAYRRLGIDLRGLQQVEGRTFRWAGEYDADMINRHTLLTELNVFESFRPDLPEAYCEAEYLLLGNIAPALQLHVLDACRKPRFVVADTMDLWIKNTRAELMKVIKRVDMLTLNDSEARLLTGIYSVRKAGVRILEYGPRYVVIKKGEHGALLLSREGMFLVPAYPLEDVRDPTGAGDTFAGAFIGALAKAGAVTHRAVRDALLVGTIVASFGVEDFSLDRLLCLKRSEITRRLAELRKMTQAER
ncbi:MAG: PfkB family carbohydrate kinase [Verrucomicrobia bacterium]|nr:PfkB family carbohydrate kinase [Verrucomicrobiota bacterium]